VGARGLACVHGPAGPHPRLPPTGEGANPAPDFPPLPLGEGRREGPRRRGMALIAVLWIVAALSIIATGITRSLRDETRSIALARQQVQAQALGDAAIQIALQALVASRQPLARISVGDVTFQGVAMQVRLMPLNGLIDPNTAGQPLLQRLFAVAGGLPPEAAADLAQGFVQWRQQRDARGAPQRLEAVQDLLRVPGVDYDLYARLAPLLTVDERGSGRVNPLAAPPGVLAVLAGGDMAVASRIAQARDAGQAGIDTSALDGSLLETAALRRLRATARVPMEDGSTVRVTRDIDLDARSPDGAPWHIFDASAGIEPAVTQHP